MHLGFLTSEFPHSRTTPSGGIGTSIKNMATALRESGVEVSVFIYGQKEGDILIENGIKIHFIPQQNFKYLGWFLYRKFLQHYLNKYIESDAIDGIEAPDWTGITAFMNLRCPLVIRMNGSDTYFCHLENRSQKKKNFWFEKVALQGADHFLSVSNFTAKTTRVLFGINKPIGIIPNSVDIQYFKPQHEKIIPNTILYFGSIIRKKGVMELPDIFNEVIKKNPECRLILAGKDVIDHKTGHSTKKLMEEKFSLQASKNVEWLGPLSYQRVIAEIAQAHVVVLPSFVEALPMTWIEAMAMEKALVTSDIGWASEIMVDGETGFTVHPRDHKEFSKRITMLLNSSTLCKRMGTSARKRVQLHFSTSVVTHRNITFYQKIIGP